MKNAQQWLHFFERVACFYREMNLLDMWHRRYSAHATDIWDSLATFLDGYAFERQGRRPDYAHAALDALSYCKQQCNGLLTEKAVNCAWECFRQLLDNQNLNPDVNPLKPPGSLIEVVLNAGIVESGHTFTTYLQTEIEHNDVMAALDFLKSIRGAGDKIAPFYLRDLVDAMGTDLGHTDNRHLLQPVDRWVRRTVRILAGSEKLTDTDVALWIVAKSIEEGVNPEQVNMGMWYFCSEIAMSEYALKKALKDLGTAGELVAGFRRTIRNACQNCQWQE